MQKRKDKPNRVYWHRNQWQYKAREDERSSLGKAWWPLGGAKDDLTQVHHNFAKLQERLNQRGGMDRLFDRWEREVLLHPSNPLDYSPRTIEDKIKHLKTLRHVFGPESPHKIRPMDCAQFLDKRGQSSKSQANQEFNTLSVVFKFAVRWGVVDINPCKGLSRHKIKDRDRLPTYEELQAFKTVCTPFMALWIDLKYKVALRQKDLLELTVRQCDFNGDGIKVRASKNYKKGFIPWDDELRDIIRGLMRLNRVQGQTVICDGRGRPLSQHTFQARWRMCMLKALKKGVISERFKEHDIRATHVEDAEKKHQLDGSDQLLHKDKRTTDKYRRNREAVVITPLPLKKGK